VKTLAAGIVRVWLAPAVYVYLEIAAVSALYEDVAVDGVWL
jgi:hypothetical protein